MKPQTYGFFTPVIPRRDISNYLANQDRISRGGLKLCAAFPFLRACRYSPHGGEGSSPGSHRERSGFLWETVPSPWLAHNEPNKAQHRTPGIPISAWERRRRRCTKALAVWNLLLCLVCHFFLDNMKLINTPTRWCNIQQQETELISSRFLPLACSPEIGRTFKSPSRKSWVPFRRQDEGCAVCPYTDITSFCFKTLL